MFFSQAVVLFNKNGNRIVAIKFTAIIFITMKLISIWVYEIVLNFPNPLSPLCIPLRSLCLLFQDAEILSATLNENHSGLRGMHGERDRIW